MEIIKYLRSLSSLHKQVKNQCDSLDKHILLQNKLQAQIVKLENKIADMEKIIYHESKLKEDITNIIENSTANQNPPGNTLT